MNKFYSYIIIGIRSFIRLLANHCVIPSFRIALFRLSGIQIGKKVFVNTDVKFLDDAERKMIVLEDEVSLAPFVSIVAFASPNMSFIGEKFNVSRRGKVYIKRGAWIGVGAVIMPGITIGKGAIIGANAVVTKDVEDYAIMVGIPAKKIGDVRNRTL